MRLKIIDELAGRLPAAVLYIVSTSSMMVGLAAQSLGFLVIARYLGPEKFGQLALITAATTLGASWCGLGCTDTMRRQIARDPSIYPSVLGHSLILITGSGFVVTAVLLVIIPRFIWSTGSRVQDLATLLLLVPASLMVYCFVLLTEQVFLARHDYLRANLVNAGYGIARGLAAVIACIGFGVSTLQAWAFWHGATHLIVGLCCVAALRRYGRPRWRILRGEVTLGATLSVSFFLAALRQNVDLLSLSTVAGPAVVGVYGVARRVIGISLVVGGSFDRLIYTKFAVAGQYGAAATLRLAQRYSIYAGLLNLVTAAALFLLAPLLPWFLSKNFSDAIPVIRILCWTLVLTGLQFLAFDALNAADKHKVRLVVSGVASIAGAGIIASLTFRYGVPGTLVGIYVCEGLIAIALWLGLIFMSRGEAQISAAAGQGSLSE